MIPSISIIIPSYNEAGRIRSTLASCHDYLTQHSYLYEIIVVDDGSSDATCDIVENQTSLIPNLTLIKLPYNQGKGAAVKAGMLTAQGDLRLFMDADSSTTIRELDKLLPYTQKGYDVIIGSRRAPGALIILRQSLLREIFGLVFRIFVRTVTHLDIKDTQNGFKLFSKEAAVEIFGGLKISGWSFDVETLLIAKGAGFKIKEVPIMWANDNQSRMTLMQMTRMPFDVLRLLVK